MLTWLITLTFNLLEGGNFLLFYILFFAKGFTWKKKKFTAIIAVYIAALCVVGFTESEAALILIVWGLILAVNLLCTKNRIYNFFMMFPAYLFFVLISVFPEYMIKQIVNADNAYIIGIDGLTLSSIIVDTLLFILLVITAVKCAGMRLSIRLNGWETGGFILYFLFAFFDIYVLSIFRISLNELAMFVSGTIVFVFAMIVFGAYWRYLFIKRKNRQLESIASEAENYISMQIGFMEKDSGNQEEIRELRHDMRSHMQVIQSLLRNGRYEDVENYVSGLSEKISVSKPLRVTGNYAADIVIATKSAKAEQDGIRFTCSGCFDGLDEILSIDVCTIFSNILDNAIEASQAVVDPEISITGIRHKNYLTLDISNNVDKPVIIKNNSVSTTKNDRKNHGIGIGNVKKTAAKYNGQCILSCSEGRFSIKVILPVYG